MLYLLAGLSVAFGIGWLSEWFSGKQMAAYLALKKIPAPTMEEWSLCAKLAWANILRRK
ncbi:MAG: hypothetical protein IKC50_05235 [Oscillospiraceae bacterium]|nr:hypothetical protein [Oscillospiraceae bacterium]MBR2977660.1 hypothetical protein [Oscillospiraceae bacterium]